MRIRWKLLILLLAIALVPLLFLAWSSQTAVDRLGDSLAMRVGERATLRGMDQLRQLVDSRAELFGRETTTLELALAWQAREVERALALDHPVEPESILWSFDFDLEVDLGGDFDLSERHKRAGPDGEPVATLVTYRRQVFLTAPGVDRTEFEMDIHRLAGLTDVYNEIRQGHRELIYGQFTSLSNGVHSSYPGHGGYPEQFDPRLRDWYTNAMAQESSTWNPPIVDASTQQVLLTLSTPVRGPNGAFAGVTAIDLRITDLVQHVRLPVAWASGAKILLVGLRSAETGGEREAVVLAQQDYVLADRQWDVPIVLEKLESEDSATLTMMIDDMANGQQNVRRMEYRGEDSLWAYASAHTGGAYLVLIVPKALVVAEANEVETIVLSSVTKHLGVASVTLLVVAGVVILIAYVGARSITEPVRSLAEMVHRVAAGDFEARTSITTGDELAELGETLNRMVPHLAERLKLRESLALAMEVQQNLLPREPPRMPGIDAAGVSIYCDETGGDYFDFLEFDEPGPRRLGVAVGDVTGHGIAPALLMTTARAMLRSRAAQPGDLAQVMTDINRGLAQDTSAGRFMTLFYLTIRPDTGDLRWVSAGHDPAFVYDIDLDSFDELVGKDLPLGVVPDWSYQEVAGSGFGPGKVIVIGTDGIWEARNPSGKMFGKDALRRVIAENAGRESKAIVRAITEALMVFRDGRAQEDDVTLVVVKGVERERI